MGKHQEHQQEKGGEGLHDGGMCRRGVGGVAADWNAKRAAVRWRREVGEWRQGEGGRGAEGPCDWKG